MAATTNVSPDQVRAGNGGGVAKVLERAEAEVRTAAGAQRIDVYRAALSAADAIAAAGEDADTLGRLYRTECERLAEEFRRLTDQYLCRLIGEK